jgi:uncharacterized membrane-anchored protein YjiN (DUF445 family)
MNWGIVEWSAFTGIVTTIIGSGLASYIGVMKSAITTKKDIDSGFKKLREVEKITSNEIHEIKIRLNNKAEKIQTLESMLYEYLKKAEAENIFCKKETMQPIVDNVIKNQEMLYSDLKEFRSEIKGSITDIVKGLNKHIDEDREFQGKLLNKITDSLKGK